MEPYMLPHLPNNTPAYAIEGLFSLCNALGYATPLPIGKESILASLPPALEALVKMGKSCIFVIYSWRGDKEMVPT